MTSPISDNIDALQAADAVVPVVKPLRSTFPEEVRTANPSDTSKSCLGSSHLLTQASG
jgi:hypothetical protein